VRSNEVDARVFLKGDYCFAQAIILYFFVSVGGCAAINFIISLIHLLPPHQHLLAFCMQQ